jgi:uncharacterized protein YutE (UPF0331/DUF86 family)
MSTTPSIHDYIAEFQKDASKAAEYAREAAEHAAKGDLQAACDVIALSHYPLGQAEDDRENLLKLLSEQGFTPGERS